MIQTDDGNGGIYSEIFSITVNDLDEIVPIFDSITVASNNSKNTSYAKAGDSVTLTLAIDPADTWKSGNNVSYTIGTGSLKNSGSYTLSLTNPVSSRNRSYSIVSGDNGTFSFTGITFQDANYNDIT